MAVFNCDDDVSVSVCSLNLKFYSGKNTSGTSATYKMMEPHSQAFTLFVKVQEFPPTQDWRAPLSTLSVVIGWSNVAVIVHDVVAIGTVAVIVHDVRRLVLPFLSFRLPKE